jgi:hypothetical protein
MNNLFSRSLFAAFAGFMLSAAVGAAAPLPATSAVHTKPDEKSPAITFLKAGSEPVVANDALATAPAGWLPVELPGPFEGYVGSKDVLKSLDLRVGAQIHLTPKPDSGILTTMEPGDHAEITGLHGRWTQVRIAKKITGYVHLGTAPATSAPAAASPTPGRAPAPMSPSPVGTTAYGVTSAGHPAPMVNLSDADGATLPRLFQGKFVSTRSAFRPRRPYDWAVNDDAGVRYAYLDISKLLLTEQIESYVNHNVVVYGAAKPVPGGKDIVIEVESLQLK